MHDEDVFPAAKLWFSSLDKCFWCAKFECIIYLRSLSEDAVNLSHEAVFSEYFRINPNYLATELPMKRNTHSKRRIRRACNYVIKCSLDDQCIERAHEVLQKLGGATC